MNPVLATTRNLARMAVPFPLRLRWHQWKRHRDWARNPRRWATNRGNPEDFPLILDVRSSPLQRSCSGPHALTGIGKEKNIALGCAAIDRLVVGPGEVFSFCRSVGPTTRKRGFVPGYEMHDLELTTSPGGGLCQLANMIFALMICSDASIVERHRHSFDLFPDVERTVPFGFGATVFYNHVDLQLENRLDQPLLLRVWIADRMLHGEARVARCPGWRMRVEESGHRFFRQPDGVWRENQLWTRKIMLTGTEQAPEPLFATRAKVMYPADHLVES
jgi:vancomycin resistance protein VanW